MSLVVLLDLGVLILVVLLDLGCDFRGSTGLGGMILVVLLDWER